MRDDTDSNSGAVRRKLGRPTICTDELIDAICARIAEGWSLVRVCAQSDMPDYSTICRWRASNSAFREKYARAREDGADAHADKIAALADDVLAGGVDPASARVALDALRWTASKLKPRSYGDRIGIEHSAVVAPLAADLAPEWLRHRLLPGASE